MIFICESMRDGFQDLKGKKVKVIYKDGDTIRSLRGVITSITSDFIRLQTLSNEFYFNRNEIVRIKILGDDDL